MSGSFRYFLMSGSSGIWLSRKFIDGWLGDLAYYRAQFGARPIDNPDQRIQQDVDVFTTGVGGDTNNPIFTSGNTLLFGAVEAVLSVLSFGPILWSLSEPVTVGGLPPLPGGAVGHEDSVLAAPVVARLP